MTRVVLIMIWHVPGEPLDPEGLLIGSAVCGPPRLPPLPLPLGFLTL
jgi:hypothetical protein